MWAIQALGRLDGQAAVDVLRATLLDQRQPPAIRGMAAEALVYARASEATADLIGVLREPEPTVRFRSAYALGELAGVETVPALEPLLADGSVVPGWWSVAPGRVFKVINRLRERSLGLSQRLKCPRCSNLGSSELLIQSSLKVSKNNVYFGEGFERIEMNSCHACFPF